MNARPYRLVSAGAVSAIGDAAAQALARWSADWGASGAELSVEAKRLDEAGLSAPADEWQPLHAGWIWKGSQLSDEVASAMGLSLPAQQDAPSLSAQTITQAAQDLATQITSLLRDPRETAALQRPADLATAARMPGHGLVIVSLKRGRSTLALIADVTAFKAHTPAAEATTPPRAADLDAALRTPVATLEVILGHTELSLADMMDLGPGDVLLLDRHIHQPLVLTAIDGQAELPVHLGRQGEHFAVQLMRPHQS